MSEFCECNGLPDPQGVLKKIIDNMEACAWVSQPELAFGAALAFMSSLVARKVTFGGMSPNLYVLNLAPSGSGKDNPQKKAKEYLIDINGEPLLGSGDYGSDAGITDSLENRPVRLDIIDECNTLFSAKGEHSAKQGDVLAELWSSSNSYYLGRSLSEGRKGSVYRPNVSILASTTNTGFADGVSLRAVEKGLLGRFIIFNGRSDTRARRLRHLPHLDTSTLNKLRWWYTYQAPENDEIQIKGIKQYVVDLKATEEAHKRLDEIFKEFDEMRINSDPMSPLLPVIARQYQQMIKICIIHACSRADMEIPTINIDDVNFGYLTSLKTFSNMEEIIENYVFSNRDEKEAMKILSLIRKSEEGVSRSDLYRKTRGLDKRKRQAIIEDLVESDEIYVDQVQNDGRPTTYYKGR